MKKKLEAELMSIAHRILKLKNRAELDQLQQEVLKLYEKLSVLKFVEDHYGGAEPTIGRASALGTLEEVYGIAEVAPVHGNEVEEQEDEARARKAEQQKADKDKAEAEAPVANGEETEVAEEAKVEESASEAEETAAEEEAPEPEAEAEAETALEEEKEKQAPVADGEESEVAEAETGAEPKQQIEKPELPKVAQPEHQEPQEEPEVKVQVEKPEEVIKAEEASAKAVFEKEIDATAEEEEKAADAEIQTIAPNPDTKVEPSNAGFEFAYERKPATEEPVKQREISFEDFHDYKEPEFVKKESDAPKPVDTPATDDWRNWEPKKSAEIATPAEATKAEEPKHPEPVRDWRDWEPAKAEPEKPKEQPRPEAPKAEAPKPSNTTFGRAISLGLNDRIAFEKNLFGGSADDLNRVISQLNTLNSFEEAQNFIDDLVKPDYNNWANKEEYEERFMAIVEKRFS